MLINKGCIIALWNAPACIWKCVIETKDLHYHHMGSHFHNLNQAQTPSFQTWLFKNGKFTLSRCCTTTLVSTGYWKNSFITPTTKSTVHTEKTRKIPIQIALLNADAFELPALFIPAMLVFCQKPSHISHIILIGLFVSSFHILIELVPWSQT